MGGNRVVRGEILMEEQKAESKKCRMMGHEGEGEMEGERKVILY